jgi:Uma2 family endonuclease
MFFFRFLESRILVSKRNQLEWMGEQAMTVAIATPINQIELTPGSALRISGVSWDRYVALLNQLGDDRATRIAYENGVLEIRMPGQPHEAINRVLAAILLTLAEEFGVEFNDLGSMTISRPDLSTAIEPDSCFYIQNAQAGQGLGEAIHSSLPPDLAVEVDIANRSDSKLSIYQAMKVPEVWLYQRGEVTIKQLENGVYVNTLTSFAFPMITTDQLNRWLTLRQTGTDLTVVRAVREFCQDQVVASPSLKSRQDIV